MQVIFKEPEGNPSPGQTALGVNLKALFGVSDQAVEKRCKKYGIQKPPRGYWAQVDADKVTDPSQAGGGHGWSKTG